MKLWDELTEEEKQAVEKVAIALAKLLEITIIQPLSDLFDDLEWFFMARYQSELEKKVS